jgi:hypothetical protein
VDGWLLGRGNVALSFREGGEVLGELICSQFLKNMLILPVILFFYLFIYLFIFQFHISKRLRKMSLDVEKVYT